MPQHGPAQPHAHLDFKGAALGGGCHLRQISLVLEQARSGEPGAPGAVVAAVLGAACAQEGGVG